MKEVVVPKAYTSTTSEFQMKMLKEGAKSFHFLHLQSFVSHIYACYFVILQSLKSLTFSNAPKNWFQAIGRLHDRREIAASENVFGRVIWGTIWTIVAQMCQ